MSASSLRNQHGSITGNNGRFIFRARSFGLIALQGSAERYVVINKHGSVEVDTLGEYLSRIDVETSFADRRPVACGSVLAGTTFGTVEWDGRAWSRSATRAGSARNRPATSSSSSAGRSTESSREDQPASTGTRIVEPRTESALEHRRSVTRAERFVEWQMLDDQAFAEILRRADRCDHRRPPVPRSRARQLCVRVELSHLDVDVVLDRLQERDRGLCALEELRESRDEGLEEMLAVAADEIRHEFDLIGQRDQLDEFVQS